MKKDNNYSRLIIILIFIVVLFFSSFIKFMNVPVVEKQFASIKQYGELLKDKQLKQVIRIFENISINGISFQIGTYKRVNTSVNNFIVYLNGEQIQNYSVPSYKIKDKQFHKIPLSIDLNAGDVLEIEWTTDGIKGNAIAPYVANKTYDSKLYIFDNETRKYKETDSTVVYKLNKKSKSPKVSLIDYYTMKAPPYFIDLTQANNMVSKLNTWIAIKDKAIIQEIDTRGVGFINALSFRFKTFARTNNNINSVYILDKDNNVLYKTEILSNKLKDNAVYRVNNIRLKIDNNKEYYIKIESLDTDDENYIAAYTIPPKIKSSIKLIDKNNNEEIKEESLFYAINNNITSDVFANVLYQDKFMGSTYKIVDDDKAIRNSKIIFCIIWLGIVIAFVIFMNYVVEFVREVDKKRKTQ